MGTSTDQLSHLRLGEYCRKGGRKIVKASEFNVRTWVFNDARLPNGYDFLLLCASERIHYRIKLGFAVWGRTLVERY